MVGVTLALTLQGAYGCVVGVLSERLTMNKQLRQALIKWASAIDNKLWEEQYGDDISKEDALAALGLVEEVCKNCEHWGYDHGYHPRKCWKSDSFDFGDRQAFVADSLGEDCWVCTGPEFGCVHWKAKERNDV